MRGPVGPPLIYSQILIHGGSSKDSASVLRVFGFHWPDIEQLKIASNRRRVSNPVALMGPAHS